MIATTIINSIRVKPFCKERFIRNSIDRLRRGC
jgi:hypothetical protein